MEFKHHSQHPTSFDRTSVPYQPVAGEFSSSHVPVLEKSSEHPHSSQNQLANGWEWHTDAQALAGSRPHSQRPHSQPSHVPFTHPRQPLHRFDSDPSHWHNEMLPSPQSFPDERQNIPINGSVTHPHRRPSIPANHLTLPSSSTLLSTHHSRIRTYSAAPHPYTVPSVEKLVLPTSIIRRSSSGWGLGLTEGRDEERGQDRPEPSEKWPSRGETYGGNSQPIQYRAEIVLEHNVIPLPTHVQGDTWGKSERR